MDHKQVFVGLSGIIADFDEIVIHEGIRIRKCHVHVMHLGMAAFGKIASIEERTTPQFVRPALFGEPWRNLKGGNSFDVTAELVIDSNLKFGTLSMEELCDILIALLRLSVRPEIIAPVMALQSFSTGLEDENFQGVLHETYDKHFFLASRLKEPVKAEDFLWLQQHFLQALSLISKSLTIKGAVEVFVDIQFVRHSAFALVSVWAALESLLAIQGEISHRVPAYLATLLEPHGPARRALYNKCRDLYKRRCKAAHEGVKPEASDLFDSIVVLRRVVIRMIETNSTLRAKDIEQLLFDDLALSPNTEGAG